jgi:hypothetical protein
VCHREQFGAYSQTGWECAIESNWERTVMQAGSVPSSAIGSVLSSRLGVNLRTYSEVYLGVYLGAS